MHMPRTIRLRAALVAVPLTLLASWSAVVPAAEPPALHVRCGLPFADNAVLQREVPLPVWGTSLPGAAVSVSFDGQERRTKADEHGAWRVVLDPLEAVTLTAASDVPAGKTMTIACEQDGARGEQVLHNLVVGDVWLCAGQSNMAGRVGKGEILTRAQARLAGGRMPALRQMVSPTAGWMVCTPETLPDFKRVCFFFARGLEERVRVPIGIVNAAVGGSKIETWLNADPYPQGGNFETLVAPLVGYGIRGMVWYQGESNAADGRGYRPKLESLITGWRTAWGQGDFPVFFVQLPGIGTSPTDAPAMGDGRAEIRQAFVECLALPKTGMAVTIDIGTPGEHPPNKIDTGERLARLALHGTYGFADVVPGGPLYRSHVVEGRRVRIAFANAEHGLMLARKDGFDPPQPVADATLGWLSVRGKDGAWHWAKSAIDGSTLVVWSDDVPEPDAVRYAYTDHPVGPLLYNKDGLPAGPFSSCGYDE